MAENTNDFIVLNSKMVDNDVNNNVTQEQKQFADNRWVKRVHDTIAPDTELFLTGINSYKKFNDSDLFAQPVTFAVEKNGTVHAIFLSQMQDIRSSYLLGWLGKDGNIAEFTPRGVKRGGTLRDWAVQFKDNGELKAHIASDLVGCKVVYREFPDKVLVYRTNKGGTTPHVYFHYDLYETEKMNIKPLEELTLSELKEYARTINIEFAPNISKENLLAKFNA